MQSPYLIIQFSRSLAFIHQATWKVCRKLKLTYFFDKKGIRCNIDVEHGMPEQAFNVVNSHIQVTIRLKIKKQLS